MLHSISFILISTFLLFFFFKKTYPDLAFDDQVVIGQVREKTRSQTTEPDHGSTTVFLLEQVQRGPSN